MLSKRESLLYESAWHDAGRAFTAIRTIFEHHRAAGHLTAPVFTKFNSLCKKLFSQEYRNVFYLPAEGKQEYGKKAKRMIDFLQPVVAEARRVSRFLPVDLRLNAINYGLVSLQALREIGSGGLGGYLRKEKVNLRQLVSQEISGEPYQDKHGRRVVAETRFLGNAMVFGDSTALRRVLLILREDASIHPESKGGIRLNFNTSRTRTDHVVLRVISRGAQPLTPELIKKIGAVKFTTRQDADERVHGLGKISAKRLVRQMGGSFRARNYYGEPALEIRLRAA